MEGEESAERGWLLNRAEKDNADVSGRFWGSALGRGRRRDGKRDELISKNFSIQKGGHP